MSRINVICCNCGENGHIYKKCTKPITSFGIICFLYNSELPKNIYKKKWENLHTLYDNNNFDIKYLLIRRKDSLSFSEFVRAKYNLSNKSYLKKILRNITIDEHKFLQDVSNPKDIWDRLWHNVKDSKSKQNEFKRVTKKLNLLINGVEDNQGAKYNLKSLLAGIIPAREFPEWGFPKGRRFPKESQIDCSLREFCEETDIKKNEIILFKNVQPLEEIFTGSNGITYKHIYYIAQLKNNIDIKLNPENIHQKTEIGDIKLFSKNNVIEKIEKNNKQRILLFTKANNFLESLILENKEKYNKKNNKKS